MTLRKAILIGTIASCGLAGASAKDWKRLSPHKHTQPKNVARFHSGATISTAGGSSVNPSVKLSRQTNDSNTSPAALLVDDSSIGYPLPSGQTTFVIELFEPDTLHLLSFRNGGGSGKVTVAASPVQRGANESGWTAAGFSVFGESQRDVRVKMGGVDAKYVRVSFDVAVSGRAYGFGVFGDTPARDFGILEVSAKSGIGTGVTGMGGHPSDDINFNLASDYAGAQVAYVSSGDSSDAWYLIDGDVTTVYSFDASDPMPTAVIELPDGAAYDRVSANITGGDGVVAIYSLQALPEQNGRLSPSAFDNLQPLQAGSANGSPIIAFDFAGTSGRYLVIQWAPSGQGGAFSVGSVGAFGAGYSLATHMVGTGRAVSAKGGIEEDGGAMAAGSLGGAGFIRGGSGGLGFTPGEIRDALGYVPPAEISGEPTVTPAPVLEIVSHLAASTYTVPGVGHVYYQAGPSPAPPGFEFVGPIEILGRVRTRGDWTIAIGPENLNLINQGIPGTTQVEQPVPGPSFGGEPLPE